MDSEWLAEANAVLDKYEKDPSRAWTATDVLATRAEGKPGAATQLPCRDDPDTLHSLKRFCYYVSPAGKMDISDDSDAEWAEHVDGFRNMRFEWFWNNPLQPVEFTLVESRGPRVLWHFLRVHAKRLARVRRLLFTWYAPHCGNPKHLDFEAEHAHPRVDYATVHVWPENWEWYDPHEPAETYPVALNRSLEYVREHVAAAERLGKPLVLEEFGMARDNRSHLADARVTWRDRYFGALFDEAYRHAAANSPLAGANVWAWGGEGRPRRPRSPSESLQPVHCWQVGDPLLGDPPHEAAGWYSIFDVDRTTHAAIANLSAALARLPVDR